MKHHQQTILALALATAVLAAPGAAFADGPIADVAHGDVALDWQPLVANAGTVLTISGPGEITLRYEFGVGEAPFFQIFDTQGFPLPDGSYTWELEALPNLDDHSRRALAAAREAGDDSYHLLLRDRGKLPAERQVQSGAFTVQNGVILDPSLEEVGAGGAGTGAGAGAGLLRSGDAPGAAAGSGGGTLSTRDFVIADDLIVDGSACIGFDCVNGEDFGFDTIRLKENNLRIKFEDTSGGNFPTNDWQLTANNSNNGGLSKFSVDDIDNSRTPFTIEARAPSHSLYVDDGGRLGLGTSTPTADVHVVSGNTPTLRLAQDGSSGFAPQTWDVAGNETSFFVRDATNGSTLPFRIRPGASSQALVIDTDGDIGMGLLSPDTALHIRGTDGNTAVHVEEASGTDMLRTLYTLENNGGVQMDFIDNDLARTWNFRVAGNNFVIDSDQSGTVEMRLRGSAADNTSTLEIGGTIEVFGGGGGTVPDYVFADDYELMPLADLAKFIADNHHLPTVPSAGEIEAKGSYNMNKMQMKLLEKVEELTLYTLDQEETINTLLEQNAELLERLTALEGANRD